MRLFLYIFNYILYIFKALLSLRATRVFKFYQVQNVSLSSTKCQFIKTYFFTCLFIEKEVL